MKIVAIIPARMGSSRFPGKPMARMLGIPMIEHVYRRVVLNPLLTATVVATCDAEVADHVRSIGGRAIMTSDRHERASDRCAEALAVVEREDGVQFDIMVMVQGDEPLVHPEMISEVVEPMMADPNLLVANLLGRIHGDTEFEDRNCIKVVVDRRSDALYFSREPIPTRARVNAPMGKQVCVIPFRRQYLMEYTRLAPTPLEIAESVDMMRVLEYGGKVRMVPTKHDVQSVDTPADLSRVEMLLRDDPLHRQIFGRP